MAVQWKLTVTQAPNITLDRSTLEQVPVGLEVGANEISLYIGDNVPTYRQNEILNGFKWLYDGIRERNLLDDGSAFNGAILYTGFAIGNQTIENRRTASAIAFFDADDVIVGMGANVTALGDMESIYSYFKILRQFALEATLKAA